VHWRRTEAAHRLQISYKTLLEKIKHYGLDSPNS
jgi:DNA-binding NtrC family response regulator